MLKTNQDIKPLASKMRPQTLKEFVGQRHLVGRGKPIQILIQTRQVVSMIFWGPPGSGKTTLARIIAHETERNYVELSAVNAGKADIKKVVEKSKEELYDQNSMFQETKNKDNNKTILFIDEIHRFNKAQQDYLLPFVEEGEITLIGATTENPSFEVISPLLSRCRVFILHQHTPDDIKTIVKNTLRNKKRGLGSLDINIKNDALEFLSHMSNGDPRTALNALELAVKLLRTS